MSPFDLFCPCCTGALLQTLAQTDIRVWQPQALLELGKGAFLAHFNPSPTEVAAAAPACPLAAAIAKT